MHIDNLAWVQSLRMFDSWDDTKKHFDIRKTCGASYVMLMLLKNDLVGRRQEGNLNMVMDEKDGSLDTERLSS